MPETSPPEASASLKNNHECSALGRHSALGFLEKLLAKDCRVPILPPPYVGHRYWYSHCG
jgi:hypothetical protein